MRLHGWHIDGFGVHHDHRVDDLPPGLSVITGPNESGKTTLQHFLSGVLFGFPNANRPDRHPPVNGGNYGGRLFVTDDAGRAITIHRGARKSSLRLTTESGDLDPTELADLVGGASKDLFQSVFAVHLADLAELKALTADQVRERVFSAGIVGAGKTAEQALADLSGARDMLLRPSGRGAFLLKSLNEDLAAARSQLALARAEAQQLPALLQELAALDTEADTLHQQARSLDLQLDLLRAVRTLWPTWLAAEDAGRQLTALGPVPAWDQRAIVALRDAIALRTERSRSLAAANHQFAEAVDAAAALPAPGPALAVADRIDAVAKQVAAEDERRSRISNLQARSAGHRTDLADALALLGPGHDTEWLAQRAPRVGAAAELRTIAAATDQARSQARSAAADQQRIQVELADEAVLLEQAVSDAAASTGPSAESAGRYLDATAKLVALIGQRDAAARHLAAAAQRTAAPTTEPATKGPGLPLTIAGAVALVVGIAAVATGATVIGIAAVAAGAVLVAVGAALGIRTPAATPTAVPADPLADHVTTELAALDAELAPVLATLGLDTRPTASQAAEIQSHAHRLAAAAHAREAARRQADDQLATHRRTAARRTEAAAAAVERTAQALAHADEAWNQWLHAHHLPATLDPAGAAEFLAVVDRARSAAQAGALVDSDLAQAQELSEAFAREVDALVQELPLDEVHDALTSVELLVAAAREAQRSSQALERATAQVEQRRAHRDQALTNFDHADADLKTLLGEVAVVDADDALQQIERVELARQLQATVDDAESQLAAAVGGTPERIAHVRRVLTDPLADPDVWSEQLADLGRQVADAHQRRDAVVRQQSAVQAQVDTLTRSADIPACELRVTDLETQLLDAVTQWASINLAHRMVEGTLARYQRERQPEVIQRAAALFRQVTDGRYTRLEVRGNDVVAINDAGQDVPAAALSQGTTEQLYLCMRFALAESFAKTAALPLLLDDITVNADADRLPRLAQMIATVAETQQVLVFSCQDRMVELLQQADPQARVITLPGHHRSTQVGRAVS